jgi:hypothetical protein
MLGTILKRKSKRRHRAKKDLVSLDPQNANGRRTKAEISHLCNRLYEIVQTNQPCTVRQVFYLAVSAGVVEKTEAAYKSIVGRLLVKMRRDGRMPYHWLADNTRWQRKPQTYPSLASALEHTAHFYRRALWDRMPVYVEIWTEKDAISGSLVPVTAQWDIPLMISRGFSSLSYLWEAAQSIKAANKPAYLYFLGDHDPSGVHIDRAIERELRGFAPDAEIHFQRLAVLPAQIKQLKLPTRPTKKSDSRSKTFTGESVEVDAIPPAALKKLVSDAITQHVDQEELERLKTVEAAEKDTLKKIAAVGMDAVQEFADGYRWVDAAENESNNESE